MLVIRRILALVNELQTDDGCVGVERIQCDRQTGYRIGRDHNRLRRTELILKRRLDIGVDKELHARRETVAGRTEGNSEWRWRERSSTDSVNAVCGGVHSVVTHEHHHPRISEPFDIREPATERGWRAANKSDGNSLADVLQRNHVTVAVNGKQVYVVP